MLIKQFLSIMIIQYWIFFVTKLRDYFLNYLFKDILKNLNIHNFRIIGINIKFTWQWGFQSQFTNQNNYERQFLISVE